MSETKKFCLRKGNLYIAQAAYGREVLEHKATKVLLTDRETGLKMIQRIAESSGLIASDRDDVLATYGRKRR